MIAFCTKSTFLSERLEKFDRIQFLIQKYEEKKFKNKNMKRRGKQNKFSAGKYVCI